jgi:probable phosphoglycerate mutase
MLVLLRHGHAASNAAAITDGTAPGAALTDVGRAQAQAVRGTLPIAGVAVGVDTGFRRTVETLELAAPALDRVTAPELGEISFGSFDRGPLAAYQSWAWSAGPAEPCPGGGESRAAAAARIADGLTGLLALDVETVVAVSHALPIRYVLDAAQGKVPGRRLTPVDHVAPFVLSREAVALARDVLARWVEAPVFVEDLGGLAAVPTGRRAE